MKNLEDRMKKQNQRIAFIPYLLAAALVLFCLAPGCRNKKNVEPGRNPPPLVETVSSGPIELSFLADPGQVQLDRDILLTMRVSAPSNIEVVLPPIENRLKGFVLNGSFTRDAAAKDGKPARDYCFRLTPTLADEYRIAPLAITWIDRSRQPPPNGLPPETASGWFASKPLLFQTAGISGNAPGAGMHDIIPPAWIYPPFKTVALWILAVLGTLGIFYILWRLSKRIHKAIQLRRMSPRERALYELNELLERNLIGKRQVKEFYLELTMIVRRYIERAHAIRAPEQTTEEFLGAAAENQEFSREVVVKLRKFLQTADLVKFAAYQPEQTVIDQTVLTARDYIETDERAKNVPV